jgi:uncharacterized protein YdeI (BOF family)
MKKIILFFMLTSQITFVYSQQSWYLSSQNGSDDNDGTSPESPFKTVDKALNILNPGDTLFFMDLFTNSSFDPDYQYSGDIYDPHIWNGENSVKISNINGTPDNYITLKAYDENTIFMGDGSNIIRVLNCSYIVVDGFNVYGQVESIPLQTAKDLQFLYKDEEGMVHYRVPPGTPEEEIDDLELPVLTNIKRPSYTDTRGMYFSNVNNVIIKNNIVRYMPGGGLRVAKSDYVNIKANVVNNCSRKSYSGTHGLIVSTSTSIDNYDGYKIFITGNIVSYNYNEIYSWSPNKTFITTHIDEGKGISLQKNQEEWIHGRMLIENNISYWNGYSGIHANVARGMDFINNTCYYNCYTALITYDDTIILGRNMGISVSTGDDIKIINNIVELDGDTKGFALSSANTTNLVVINNLIYGDGTPLMQDSDIVVVEENTIESDPMFADPDAFDFHLLKDSPAIDAADTSYAPENDFFGNSRDEKPDLGAIEYIDSQSINESATSYNIYPDPFSNNIIIESNNTLSKIELYSISGKRVEMKVNKNKVGKTILNTTLVPSGIYILKTDNFSKILIKR